MLGSEVPSVRLGGIYALQRLTKEHQDEYHLQIMRLLCAFIRNPTKGGEGMKEVGVRREGPHLREDLGAVMKVIGERSESGLLLEKRDAFALDLSRADLKGGELVRINLAGAFLRNTDLSDAVLVEANLCKTQLLRANLENSWLVKANLQSAHLTNTKLHSANLTQADLSGAYLFGSKLIGANLSDANFTLANLRCAYFTGANLSHAHGITQAELDQAHADPNNPPNLDGAIDPETGKQLIWHGRPVEYHQDEDSNPSPVPSQVNSTSASQVLNSR